MMEDSDQNLVYALRAIQEPQLRETEEFHEWIGIPENRELFLDLMACKLLAIIFKHIRELRRVAGRKMFLPKLPFVYTDPLHSQTNLVLYQFTVKFINNFHKPG